MTTRQSGQDRNLQGQYSMKHYKNKKFHKVGDVKCQR